jgi:hypothetical protein
MDLAASTVALAAGDVVNDVAAWRKRSRASCHALSRELRRAWC